MKSFVDKLIEVSVLVVLVAGLLTLAIGSFVLGFTIGVLIRFLMLVVLVILLIVIIVLAVMALLEKDKKD